MKTTKQKTVLVKHQTLVLNTEWHLVSEEDANNWFEDSEYQQLSEHRRNGTLTHSITFTKVLKR